jgi:uncharacterized membrane protein SirB2
MRGFMVFSAFRAVYGIGILVVTYLLVTNESAPWWTSLLFLMASMVLSRIIFRSIKRTWPSLFETETTTDVAGVNESNQTTP